MLLDQDRLDPLRAELLPLISDGTFEANETFTISLSGPSGAILGATTTHTVSITNDDLPTIAFTIGSSSVSESGSSIAVSVTLGTGVALPSAVSASYTTSNVSALSGQDYTGISGTVTFPAGSTNGAVQTVTVTITSDSSFEGNEAFSLLLSSPSGAVVVSPTIHSVTITDDDLPTVSFSSSSSSVSGDDDEGGRNKPTDDCTEYVDELTESVAGKTVWQRTFNAKQSGFTQLGDAAVHKWKQPGSKMRGTDGVRPGLTNFNQGNDVFRHISFIVGAAHVAPQLVTPFVAVDAIQAATGRQEAISELKGDLAALGVVAALGYGLVTGDATTTSKFVTRIVCVGR